MIVCLKLFNFVKLCTYPQRHSSIKIISSNFFRCFLALLLIAAVLWKIKQKYDRYRRRQRLFVEMEQMASRPFGSVLVELEKLPDHSSSSSNPGGGSSSSSSALPNSSTISSALSSCENPTSSSRTRSTSGSGIVTSSGSGARDEVTNVRRRRKVKPYYI